MSSACRVHPLVLTFTGRRNYCECRHGNPRHHAQARPIGRNVRHRRLEEAAGRPSEGRRGSLRGGDRQGDIRGRVPRGRHTSRDFPRCGKRCSRAPPRSPQSESRERTSMRCAAEGAPTERRPRLRSGPPRQSRKPPAAVAAAPALPQVQPGCQRKDHGIPEGQGACRIAGSHPQRPSRHGPRRAGSSSVTCRQRSARRGTRGFAVLRGFGRTAAPASRRPARARRMRPLRAPRR